MKSIAVHRSKLDEVCEDAARFHRMQVTDRETPLELEYSVMGQPNYQDVVVTPDGWDKVGVVQRLAAKSREHGDHLRRDKTGRYFASSLRQPGTWHFVTGISCMYIGFQRHQRCVHNSTLLVASGSVLMPGS